MSGNLNVIAARFYKTSAPGILEGQWDTSVPEARFRLYRYLQQSGGGMKLSQVPSRAPLAVIQQLQADADLLGGWEKASAQLEEREDELRSWLLGEREGVAFARLRYEQEYLKRHGGTRAR